MRSRGTFFVAHIKNSCDPRISRFHGLRFGQMRSRELQSSPRESKISFYGEFELLDKNLLEREQIVLFVKNKQRLFVSERIDGAI